MKREHVHKKYLNLTFFIAMAASWCFAAVSICFAQDKDGLTRYVETGKSFKAPVSVSMASSIYGNIPLDQPFIAQNDWLKNFAIGFINDDEKPITHFSLGIHFPKFEKEQSKIGFVYSIEYGESPYADQDGEFLVNTARPIKKGEKIVLKLSDEDYDRIIEGLKVAGSPPKCTRSNYKYLLLATTIIRSGGQENSIPWTAIQESFILKKKIRKPVGKFHNSIRDFQNYFPRRFNWRSCGDDISDGRRYECSPNV